MEDGQFITLSAVLDYFMNVDEDQDLEPDLNQEQVKNPPAMSVISQTMSGRRVEGDARAPSVCPVAPVPMHSKPSVHESAIYEYFGQLPEFFEANLEATRTAEPLLCD